MRKSLLLSMLIAMMACFGVQAQSWQYELELTTADASARKVMGMYNQVTTPVYTLDEATSTIRLTVFSTNNVDNNFPNGFTQNSSAFPTFALGEIRLFDGEGNKVEVTADMITTNALALNEGSIDALVDDDLTTHFHSTYSDGEVPQAYHYIEIALSEPMSKFQLQWDTRYYYFYTDPTYVGITGGTEALPWKDEEFVLGEQVTSIDALQPNKLYVIRGNYFEFTRTENQRTLPSYGEAFYHSPIGAALTPSPASLMWLEDAGEGKYFMHWLKYDRYIKKGGEIEAGAYVEATANPLEAAALEFAECDTTDGAFIITSDNNYLGQRRFVKMSWVNKDNMAGETSTYHYAWNIYEASTNMTSTQPILEATIAKGENFMAIQGIASEDDGEYEALSSAIAEAKAAIAGGEATADELLAMDATLNEYINSYRITYIYVLSDSIEEIINNEDIFCGTDGWVKGCFPETWIETLTNTMDEGGMVADNPINSATVEAAISMMCNNLDLFYSAEVKDVATWPIYTEDKKDGLTASDQVGNSWIWTSPVYYLGEATDVIRMTVFKNSSGETESGTPFFCLGEMYLFTASGDTIELREDMLSTNSLQWPNDGAGLAGICDGDVTTFYHGCYDPTVEGSYAPAEGEYAYIEIALDEPINAFFYKTVSRNNSSDHYKHTAMEYALTAGTAITYNDLFPDLYPVTQGEQITDASQVQAGELYLLYGNLDVVTNGSEGSGYYNSTWQNVGTTNPGSVSIVTFEDAGDGKLYMRNISNNGYLKIPAGWEGASVTHITAEAAPLSIMNSTNLEKSFKIYYEGVITDPSETAAGGYGSEAIFVMQAWAGNIGMFTIADWESDDKDGESDWYIYKASVEKVAELGLKGAIASVESFGIDYENAGDAVGMLKAAAIEPIANAYAKAVAVLESGDEAAMEAATTELRDVIQTIPAVETVELISGNDYIIRSANKEFKPYHGQDCKISMFVGPSNGSGADANAENMLWFNYEYSINGMDSSIFHFTFTQDTVVNEGEEAWAKYTIKNVYYNEYIVPAFPNGMNITTSPYSSNDAAPLIYLRPMAIGQFAMVGVNAWHQDNYPTYSYFETRTGGGPYGTSGAAHYGRVATWSYSANTAQWQIVPVAVATSINDIVVDEPAGEVISTSYITPDGVTSNVPVKGVCIIRRVYANGVITTEKEFIK
ncbi:MAG: hypothetical protein IJC08_03385 [Bacteroidaceae bacterium]|nr:hypothetical protein [Bacteroidaceae bacterium]